MIFLYNPYINNLQNDILHHFSGKMKTCRDLLLLPNSLMTCFSQILKDIPNLKYNSSPERHTFIKIAKEHNYMYYSMGEIV